MAGGVMVSNGLAWSPDGGTLYYFDSRGGELPPLRRRSRHWDDRAAPDLRVDAARVGRPDGGAMDEEGCYWGCGIGAGRINWFSPAGELYRGSPAAGDASHECRFGGADRRTLYVTSLREGLTDADLATNAAGGGLFRIEVAVTGMGAALYKRVRLMAKKVALSGAGGIVGGILRKELQQRGVDLRSAGGHKPLEPIVAARMSCMATS